MSVTDVENLSSDLDSSEGAPGVPTGVSGAEYLKKRKQQIARREPKLLTLSIPEWVDEAGGGVGVKFGYPEQGATPIIRAGLRLQNQEPEKGVDAALDIVLGSAVEVLWRESGDSPWRPIDPSGAPTRIGEQLARTLGLEVAPDMKRKARFIARNLWSPNAAATGVYEGDIALVKQAGRVASWLDGEDAEANEEVAGE